MKRKPDRTGKAPPTNRRIANRPLRPQIFPRDDGTSEIVDLARNAAGFDDRLLSSADLNLLRATLREFRDQARAALSKASERGRFQQRG